MSTDTPTQAAFKPSVELMKLRLAAQYGRAPERRALEQYADRVEQSNDYAGELRNVNWRSASQLRALVEQAIEAGAPGDIVLRIMQHEAKLRPAVARLTSMLIYPAFLLTVSILLVKLLQIAYLNPEAFQWMKDWGLTNYGSFMTQLADFENFVNGLFITLGWLGVLVLTIQFAASRLTRLRVLINLPLGGSCLRFLALSRLLNRISVFVSHQPDIYTAIRMTARGFGNDPMGEIANHLAERSEAGSFLGYAVHQTLLSDGRAGVILASLDVAEATLSKRLYQTALTFQVLSALWERRLQVITPLLMLLLMVSVVGNAASVYFNALQTLISLISSFA